MGCIIGYAKKYQKNEMRLSNRRFVAVRATIAYRATCAGKPCLVIDKCTQLGRYGKLHYDSKNSSLHMVWWKTIDSFSRVMSCIVEKENDGLANHAMG